MRLLNNITPMEENFAKWYQDVVVKGNLIAYSDVKGLMIFKPIAYGIWENIQKELNNLFAAEQIRNVYLPSLIPLAAIEKEQKHIAGFAPELATVTKVGTKKLEQELVLRPTSEVLFGPLFASEINSYNDLPLIYNQWASVIRWEKTTNPFLRNREFLWQEGHTAHANDKEAQTWALKMIKLYQNFVQKYLAMPTISGQKTEREKFSGAVNTYTIEAMMKDGKALQAGTSHFLGTNFAKPFNIMFKNKNNEREYVKQTSWGVSTRLIGGLIMTHGDNRGIIIPPRIAPYQIDILDLMGHKEPGVRQKAKQIGQKLAQEFRIRYDFSNKSLGQKAAQSEIEGTPLRIEIGKRDLATDQVLLVRRDTLTKTLVKVADLTAQVKIALTEIQANLLQKATEHLETNIVEVKTYEEFKKEIKKGKFVLVPFTGSEKDEAKIQTETLATARCILLNHQKPSSPCVITNESTNNYVIFARAY